MLFRSPIEDALPREPGMFKHLAIPDALFDPLPAEEADLWE